MSEMEACRACLTPSPYLFLPMGQHPPANMFVRPTDVDRPQPAFSLDAHACLNCGLIQVADQIPADFYDYYFYMPSGAETMHRHFGELAEILCEEAKGGWIVDIGCNDGLLLQACNGLGGKTVGIDPAANIAEIARQRGVDVRTAFFSPATAEALKRRHGPAQVIVATNTFNSVDDLHEFMVGISGLLAEDGLFVIEVPWAKDLLERNEFDTVYQEHLSEFSLLSIVKLAAHFGFTVTDAQRLEVHGGSIRVFLRRSAAAGLPSLAVGELLHEERAGGMLDVATYDAFAERVETIRRNLLSMLHDLKVRGKKIAGYGAPAKGNTLLNFFKIGPSELDFLVDRNPLKHDMLSPGMKIPIRPPEAIESERPDVLLVLAWNFFEEIREQQADFARRGGKFLVPLPRPVLVG